MEKNQYLFVYIIGCIIYGFGGYLTGSTSDLIITIAGMLGAFAGGSILAYPLSYAPRNTNPASYKTTLALFLAGVTYYTGAGKIGLTGPSIENLTLLFVGASGLAFVYWYEVYHARGRIRTGEAPAGTESQSVAIGLAPPPERMKR